MFGLRGLGLGATIGSVSGRSAVGSAPRSGRGGRWFKSSRPDQLGGAVVEARFWVTFVAGSAAVDITLPSGAKRALGV